MKINKILIIGAGQMGSGIAQVMAQAGLIVTLHDINQKFVDKGLKNIEINLTKALEKNKLTISDKNKINSLINGTTKLDTVTCNVNLVIEAASEEIEIKYEIFKKIDSLCPPDTILTTNTSSLSITAIAAITKRPKQVIGLHFFNPPTLMKLVEIIKGMQTSEETFEIVRLLTEKLNKSPIKVSDFPGFIGNRIIIPMINEAIFALMEGVAKAEDIDNVAKLGFNHPMGPLALSDLIGNDTVLHIMEVLYQEYCDPKYRPCPLLKKMVQAKLLGRKTGHGFYEYNKKE